MNTFSKRTEIDLNECEHFLKENWDQSKRVWIHFRDPLSQSQMRSVKDRSILKYEQPQRRPCARNVGPRIPYFDSKWTSYRISIYISIMPIPIAVIGLFVSFSGLMRRSKITLYRCWRQESVKQVIFAFHVKHEKTIDVYIYIYSWSISTYNLRF